MSKSLNNINVELKSYVETLGNISDVGIEILDLNKQIIVNTTNIKDTEYLKGYTNIYDEIDSGIEEYIMKDAKNDKICTSCYYNDNCGIKMKIAAPIIYEGSLLGYIGLIGLTEAKKEFMIENIDFYRRFIEQIIDFIHFQMYKINEKKLYDERIDVLNSMLNNLKQNVLILGINDKISALNESAGKALNLKEEDLGKKVMILDRKEPIMGENLYNLTIDSQKYQMIGQLFPIKTIFTDYQKIFIFDHAKKVNPDTYNVTNTGLEGIISIDTLISESKVMEDLKDKLIKIAPGQSTVLIRGESGTGKELIARIIHSLGNRKNQPFVSVNCSAIPESMLESELFGYVEGVYTNSKETSRPGKFEEANGGIILLDEIGDMPLQMQVKLLRVIQERQVVRVGSTEPIDLDIRIIAASNLNLEEMIQEKKFREDLYYRLNVIPIDVPPLRDRKEDFDMFLNRLIVKYNDMFNKNISGIEEDCKKMLKSYPWPGNVRELQNTMEYMVNIADNSGFLTKDMLPRNILDSESNYKEEEKKKIRPLEEIELEHIHRAIEIFGDSTEGKRKAANKLGIGVATLYRKIQN